MSNSRSVYKKDIINTLFVIGFPMYGIGLYLAAAISPTAGSIFCVMPYMLIILFHWIDLLYKREFHWRINANYWLILLYLLSVVVSLFVAFNKNLPDLPFHLLLLKVLLIIVPIHSFIVVYAYNRDGEIVTRLTFKGLTMLLFINIVGYYGLDLSNQLHNIAGRINFPFLDGLYSVASLLAILNLMIYYYLKRVLNRPVTTFYLGVYFLMNLFFLFHINSRLFIMVFLLVLMIFFFNLFKRFTGIFATSLFTLPLLINGSFLIYEIVSLPVFQSVLQRVHFFDIITFNGRSFLWESAINWLLYDQEGLIFGNGYRGHYFLDLLGGLGMLFDLTALHHVHLHSTTLEILVSQGLVGLSLFIIILYKAFKFYRRKYQEGVLSGAFFPVIVYLIFIVHIDTYGYLENSGGLIIALLISRISIRNAPEPVKEACPFFTHNGYVPSFPN